MNGGGLLVGSQGPLTIIVFSLAGLGFVLKRRGSPKAHAVLVAFLAFFTLLAAAIFVPIYLQL